VVIGGFSLVLHASCMCSARAEHCVFERQSICSAALVLHLFFPLFLLFFSCLKFGSDLLSAIVSVGDQPTLLDKTNRNLRPPLPQCQWCKIRGSGPSAASFLNCEAREFVLFKFYAGDCKMPTPLVCMIWFSMTCLSQVKLESALVHIADFNVPEEFVFQSFDRLTRAGFGENSLGRLQVIERRR